MYGYLRKHDFKLFKKINWRFRNTNFNYDLLNDNQYPLLSLQTTW